MVLVICAIVTAAVAVGIPAGHLAAKAWKERQREQKARLLAYQALWGRKADPEHGIEAEDGVVQLVKDHVRTACPPAHTGGTSP